MVRKVSTHTWNPIIFQDRTLRGTDGDHVVPWFCRVFFTRPSMVPHGFPQFFPNLTSKPLVLLHVASMCETRRSSAGSLRPQAPILHSSSAIRTASRCRSMLGGCGVASLRDLAQQVLMSGAPYGAPGFSIGKLVESIRHILCLMVESISWNIMKYLL